MVFKTSSGVKSANTNNLQVANLVQGSCFGWMRATLVFDNSLKSPMWSSSFIMLLSTSRCIWSLSYLNKTSAGAVIAVSRSSLMHEYHLVTWKHSYSRPGTHKKMLQYLMTQEDMASSVFTSSHLIIISCDYICRKNYFFLAWNMLKKIARDRFPSPPSVSKGYHYYYNRSL